MFTLIGDIVGSRRLVDRARAQALVNDALERVTAYARVAQRLEPTVGDEFQGGFATLGDAVRASLLVRLELLPEIDVRCGLGVGDVVVHDESRTPLLQDGPGWWAARDALAALDGQSRARRTWYVVPSDGAEEAPPAGGVNAFLAVRDALVDRLNDRSRRMLLLALTGRSQREIADVEGVTKSAVSQAFARGVGAVVDAQTVFEKG